MINIPISNSAEGKNGFVTYKFDNWGKRLVIINIFALRIIFNYSLSFKP